MECDLIQYEIAFVAVVFVCVCYGKTLKHLMASRCTSIRFGCIACDRQPLGDAAAVSVVESPEVLNIGGPTIEL
jgi:hypothetical protein